MVLQHAQRPDHRLARARGRRPGYVLKDTSSEDLLEGVRPRLQAGNAVFERRPRHAGRADHTRSARQNPLAELTPRELQILSLLAEGKPYGDIANEINVSYKTVVNVSSQLKHKLEARNLPELIRTAVQLLQTAADWHPSREPDLVISSTIGPKPRSLPKLPASVWNKRR